MDVKGFKIIAIALFLYCVASIANAEWNGVGVIQTMYIYPDYAVIIQGDKREGRAGCSNSNSWSFKWSQFDALTQGRIHSMLLSAYVSKTRIQVQVSDKKCGPEGKKKFVGHINLP